MSKNILLLIIPIIIILLLKFYNSYRISQETYNLDTLQIVDEVTLTDKFDIIWFRKDLGIADYSSCMLGFKEVGQKHLKELNVFFISDYITNIFVKDNKLLIELYEDKYSINRSALPDSLDITINLDGVVKNSYWYRINSSVMPPK